MVGGVRSALILLAACTPVAPPPIVHNTAPVLGDVQWPERERLPELPNAPDIDAPLAATVITSFGPPRGEMLSHDQETKLRAQLATLTGVPRLEALDRLAETADIDADEGFDGEAVIRKLERAVDEHTALIREPGFAKYPAADRVLYRAARIEFELQQIDGGETYVKRILADYPRSRWIADAYVLLGAAKVESEPTDALAYLDEAIAIGHRPLTDYAHFKRLAALDVLGRTHEQFAEAVQLATTSDPFREPALLQSLRAFVDIDEPSNAARTYGALDREHLPTLLRRVSDAYLQDGKPEAAELVLTDLLAATEDPVELCATHARLFVLELGQHRDALREGRAWVEQAKRVNDPRCNRLVDDKLASAAWDASSPGDAAALWALAIAVATPERKTVELRDRMYVVWQLARTRHDAEGWLSAAAACDAAFAAERDHTLEAGAALARSNARALTRTRPQ